MFDYTPLVCVWYIIGWKKVVFFSSNTYHINILEDKLLVQDLSNSTFKSVVFVFIFF